jgi:hypothetical protein
MCVTDFLKQLPSFRCMPIHLFKIYLRPSGWFGQVSEIEVHQNPFWLSECLLGDFVAD